MKERPNDLVTVFTGGSQMEADAVVAMLEADGIPAFSFAIADQTINYLPITVRSPTVQVARVDLERARIVIHDAKRDSVDLDWDEVDLGEPADESVRKHLESKKTKGVFRSETLKKTGFAAILASIGGWFGG